MATLVGTEGLRVTYTTTGTKEAYKVGGLINGVPAKASVSIQGGSSDVFTFKEKLGGSNGLSVSSLNSVNGVIKPITFDSLPEEFLLDITTNISGSITMLITVGF